MSAKIFAEHYPDMDALLDTIGARPNNAWAGDGRRQSSDDGDEHFTQSKNYADSESIARRGYREGAEKLIAGTESIGMELLEHGQRARRGFAMVGSAPSIGRALSGIPTCYRTRYRQETDIKACHIVINNTAHGGTNADHLAGYGVNVLSAVDVLESSGIRCDITAVVSADGSDTHALMAAHIKHAGEPLDCLSLAYPIIHPSYLRRTYFKWLETVPGLEQRHGFGGYGSVKKLHTYDRAVLLAALKIDTDATVIFLDYDDDKTTPSEENVNAIIEKIRKQADTDKAAS